MVLATFHTLACESASDEALRRSLSWRCAVFGYACGTMWGSAPLTEAAITWTSAAAAGFAIDGGVAMNAAIVNISQNFVKITPNTVLAGHLSVPAASAAGAVVRWARFARGHSQPCKRALHFTER